MDDIPELVAIESAVTKKIPITIITGFLGAGKTTFLNYILKENYGKKIVVIQNELGDRIGLEEAMVISKNEFMEWIEFANGCLCCTVKEEMLLAIEKLVKNKPVIDAIFIETDGLADPEPLVRSLWVDAALESSIYLDAVICIVDTVYFLKELSLGKNEAYRQVAFADVILINKIDCAHNTDLEKILSEINPLAEFYKTINGRVDINLVLNINAFDITHANHFNEPTDHHHDLLTRAITITDNGLVTVELVNKWLARLLWEESDMVIYRMKGVLNVAGTMEKYNLQAVMQTFDVQPSNIMWDESETRNNKIIIIGKKLASDLEKNFHRECIVIN